MPLKIRKEVGAIKRDLTAAFCFAVILMIAGGAGATTLQKLGDAEMAQQAGAIVIGRCVAAESQWAGKTLVTLVRVEVREALKGSPADELTVVIPGGIDDSRAVPVAVIYPGAPALFDQEHVLLFLTDSGLVPGGYDIVGFNQGKFTVVEGPSGVQLAVGKGKTMPLEQKKSQIRHHLAEGR